ncbi:MAG: hypothetical protein JKX81_01045 [Arenicella sp.]|nr:hypothetical protein [Arenicella sp.]
MLNVMGAGIHSEAVIYDADFIRQRSKVIGYAISARKQHFPDEVAYEYRLHSDGDEVFDWNAGRMADLKDYNLRDLSI